MSRYVGTIAEGGDSSSAHTVTVEYAPGDVRLLDHKCRHSPTGFSWGYGGSGPADLARSIMWDYLDEEPHPACYQAFKFAFVARWAQDEGWAITTEDIDRWLTSHYEGQICAASGGVDA